MLRIMKHVNDWDAFKKVMQEAEDAYVKEADRDGETTYVGFDEDWGHYKFMEEENADFHDWLEGMCTEVMSQYLKDPNNLGCSEIADGLDCLACGCRNYSFCIFMSNTFEDWREFLQYCIDERNKE